MRGFSSPKTQTVTLTRPDGESASFTMHALPVGYNTWLKTQYPHYASYKNGEPHATKAQEAEYNDLLGFLLIAKAMEPGVLESQPPKGESVKAWQTYAEAVRDEFKAANLTDAECFTLARTVIEMNFSLDAVKREGNG